ncbi:BTF3L4 isoform 5 [Pan troglodytes]|uniref:Basic transcription factor 3 like 4 n=5 Tax=Homininae TaxID=207598 RepID=E9PPC3_HUMAN|nr:basic transcription factor 3 like 4 [Homo sapiens]KAI4080663.1 basic transcription factor 3 like 4 [Homo sapiens]PNI71536.1 BTF3L4 isoform 5 [Pan troglodytes]
MNQEKLAKLQAQVRIGGKVFLTNSYLFFHVGEYEYQLSYSLYFLKPKEELVVSN